MINTFLEYLPYKVGDQLRIEFDKRLQEIRYLVSGRFHYYTSLSKNIETLEMLLALSIFHKRILTNFDSASKFTGRLIFEYDAKSLILGTYEMNRSEMSKLNKIVLIFRNLMNDYSINIELFEYSETIEFMRKIKQFKKAIIQ